MDSIVQDKPINRMVTETIGQQRSHRSVKDISGSVTDFYISADVETDGPIPGSFSMLSFALVYAGTYDGKQFECPHDYNDYFYREIKPISQRFQDEALSINKLDRQRLLHDGTDPRVAMNQAFDWIVERAGEKQPVLVAYPLSFDWTWLFWYFTEFCDRGSPFNYSRCFDIKTALSIKSGKPISASGRSRLPKNLASRRRHTHHAVDDAIEQAEIFSSVFRWRP